MATLLSFPLAMPLGGGSVADLRIRPLGGRRWRLFWTPINVAWSSAFMIAVDGKHYATVSGRTSLDLRLEGTLGDFSASPVIEVIQVPADHADPGYFVSGYFTVLQDNKIRVTWTPPVDVSDVVAYRVYWDRGEGTVPFSPDSLLGFEDIREDGSLSYEAWTPALTSGTYLFVVRTIDDAGNESANTTAFSRTISTYPDIVTGLSITYSPIHKICNICLTSRL